RRGSKNQYKVKKESNNVMYRFISDLVNFLEFYNRDELVYFINDLNEHKTKIKLEKNYRKMQSIKDMLTIKQCLDSWYEEAVKTIVKNYLNIFLLFYGGI